jgi:hypothetical protein
MRKPSEGKDLRQEMQHSSREVCGTYHSSNLKIKRTYDGLEATPARPAADASDDLPELADHGWTPRHHLCPAWVVSADPGSLRPPT